MIDGFVLAGGRSRRMGAPKAWIRVGDQTLGDRVSASMARIAGPIRYVVRPDTIISTDNRAELVVEPPRSTPHLLWGLAAALRASRTPLCAVAACDLPFLEGAHWEALVAACGDGGSVGVDDSGQPGVALVLPVGLAEEIEAMAAAGASFRRLAEGRRAVALADRALIDVDSPEDLERWLGGARGA